MTHSPDESPERLLRFFCQKTEDTWKVVMGPGWLPTRLRPFFDDDFECGRLLLDFDYLEDTLDRRGAKCEIRRSKQGDVEVSARGSDTQVLAMWLGAALASGMQPVKP